MNIYIHPDNQKLLWTTIHSVPMIANLPNEFKTEWFKEIVKKFYEKYPHIHDKGMLQQVNKQTVHYMVQNAKTVLSQYQGAKPEPVGLNRVSAGDTSAIGITSEFTRYEMDSKKNTEWYNKAFTERQREYEIMHAKPLAPEVNFSIAMDDAPLNNMDELIEKYKKERENDMKPFPPPAVASSVSAISPIPAVASAAPAIKSPDMSSIMEEVQKMKKEIQHLRAELDELKKKPSRPLENPPLDQIEPNS